MESLNFLIRHRTDGLLIAPANSHGEALHSMLKRTNLPIVAIDRPIDRSSIPSVVANNFDGAKVATEHLIGHGYKRILCLTGESGLYTISERIDGYRATMSAAGLQCLLDTSVTDYKSATVAIQRALAGPEPPNAIFTLKNVTTIYALILALFERLNFRAGTQLKSHICQQAKQSRLASVDVTRKHSAVGAVSDLFPK